MESYGALKARHTKEWNDFEGMFWAFNNNQFKEGMEKVGLKVEEVSKIFSIGAGGFIRKDVEKAFEGLLKRQKEEVEEQRKDKDIYLDSLVYELRNHEYNVTYDVEDALNALGLKEEDVDKDLLKKACRIAGR